MANLDVSVELNSKGIQELLNSKETMECIEEFAKACKPSMEGYMVDAFHGKVRANARITAVYQSAQRDNQQNNTLLKAITSRKGGS